MIESDIKWARESIDDIQQIVDTMKSQRLINANHLSRIDANLHRLSQKIDAIEKELKSKEA